MEGADPSSPVRGLVHDDDGGGEDDKATTSSLVEREEFPEDFEKHWRTDLNFSRLEDDDGESRVAGWVFWSRQDDRPNRPPVSDCENLNLVPYSNPKVKDRIRLALGRIILHPRFGPSLVQYWAATTTEGPTLLSTQNQPFALGKTGRSTRGLCGYRMKSMEYKFYGDIGGSREEELGLPGRVFLHRLPESSPDVQCYSLKEYPQRDDASRCQVRASWALPVLEHSSQICVGVLELVSSINAITDWYDKSFFRNLNDVLQELGLESIDPCKHYEVKRSKDEDKSGLTTALNELTSVLQSVSKIHKLPMALTWVPCSACNALSLGQLPSEFGEYLGVFGANNSHLIDFVTVSTGYHLRKGQIAEKAQSFPNILYCSDITQFSIVEYPLVPFARQCKLSGWFTICLRSSYTGENNYILEFFLPVSRKENWNTLTTVSTILGIMKANTKTFKLASGEELGELLSVKVFDFQNGQRHQHVESIQASLELLKNGGTTLQHHQLDLQSFDRISDGVDVISTEQDDTLATISESGTIKTHERKHKKTGVKFAISLEDVLRVSASTRKHAARELKVSESTLKRVCRGYGIDRWPPRKEAFPVPLPNVGEIVVLESPEEQSLMELDATIIRAQDVGTECSQSSISLLEDENAFTFQDPQQHFGQKRKDVAQSPGVSVSALKRICRDTEIKQWSNQQFSSLKLLHNDGGAKMLPDSPTMDPVSNVRSSNAERSISDVTCSQDGTNKTHGREQGKIGVRIQISLEDILLCSGMKLEDAARKLKVSSSTLKRVCREYSIYRWPPRNINKGDHPQPLQVEHPEGVSDLTFDTNQVSVFQETKTVTIRAKYVDGFTIKFQLSMSSKLVELQQEVTKRLNLEAGTYDVTYEDDDGEVILIACDDDLKDCMNTFRSLGKNIVVVLAPKKPMTHLSK